jgi:hypothetical protein
MIREVSATTAQHNLSELLNKVQFQHEQVFQSMSDEVSKAFAESSEDEIDALISEAKKAK